MENQLKQQEALIQRHQREMDGLNKVVWQDHASVDICRHEVKP